MTTTDSAPAETTTDLAIVAPEEHDELCCDVCAERIRETHEMIQASHAMIQAAFEQLSPMVAQLQDSPLLKMIMPVAKT